MKAGQHSLAAVKPLVVVRGSAFISRHSRVLLCGDLAVKGSLSNFAWKMQKDKKGNQTHPIPLSALRRDAPLSFLLYRFREENARITKKRKGIGNNASLPQGGRWAGRSPGRMRATCRI